MRPWDSVPARSFGGTDSHGRMDQQISEPIHLWVDETLKPAATDANGLVMGLLRLRYSLGVWHGRCSGRDLELAGFPIVGESDERWWLVEDGTDEASRQGGLEQLRPGSRAYTVRDGHVALPA
jgi:hypothetical protein